jgi:hypothetical protein
MNVLPSKIKVNLKTSGFKIISFGFQKERDPVEVDVGSSLKNTQLNWDVLAISTQSFLPDFSRELGKEVTISGFQPDSIVFNFSDLVTKRVPVVFSFQADFEKQYDSTGSPFITPSEIVVSGPPSIVEKLKYIQTEDIRLEKLKASAKGKAKLRLNRLLSYNVNEINYTLPVEMFTEGSQEIEIHPINVTHGFVLKTFPEKIKVRYLVALSQYNKVEQSMFDAVVDADELKARKSAKLGVKLITQPSIVRITLIEPGKVDYILRKQ